MNANPKKDARKETSMATKDKPTKTAKLAKNVISVTLLHKDENTDAATVRVLTKPEIQAAVTIQKWEGELYDVNALASTLALQIEAVNKGDMKRPEAMLLAQAHTLDELFNNLARSAKDKTGLAQFEIFMRLALKAQSQCRATLETLAAIKNPPVIFAKQANISNGHQQINNGNPTCTHPRTHAGENNNQTNELLEVQNGSEKLDTSTAGATIGKDMAMAALD